MLHAFASWFCRPRLRSNVLQTKHSSLVSEVFGKQLTGSNCKQRRAIHSRNAPYSVGVIGGGITGLTTVFRLTEDPNCTHITLYEKSSQLGGWLQSETVEVDGGEVVFEYGPRTLRTAVPSSLPMLDLVRWTGVSRAACTHVSLTNSRSAARTRPPRANSSYPEDLTCRE
jgi:NAD(P)-binding Rossmann-like domain